MNAYRDQAHRLDAADELARYRSEFYLPAGKVYFDGNSLGLLSKRAEQSTLALLETWKEYAIDGWTEGPHPWFYLSESIGAQLAPLIGAQASEVIATGSTTIDLHQTAGTFYKPAGRRTKILADSLNFPSDIYALQSLLASRGYDASHLVQVESEDGVTLSEQALIDAMADDVALILLPSVLYRSGQILDMERLTAAAGARGIPIGFDLCHSIGSIPHHLSEWGVDFAMWCNYKHLNGGPGAVAGLYVNEKHFGAAPALAGWFSSAKDRQFDMEHTLEQAPDAGAYQISTPHVLSLAPLLGSLSMFEEAGIEAVRAKSLKLTRFLLDLVKEELGDAGFAIATPEQDERRGGHVLLGHPEGARICKALKAEGVVPDYRAPNFIRLAPVAFYNTFEEVVQTVETLKRIMDGKLYEQFENKRGVVA